MFLTTPTQQLKLKVKADAARHGKQAMMPRICLYRRG
jgi:hypothetical protein